MVILDGSPVFVRALLFGTLAVSTAVPMALLICMHPSLWLVISTLAYLALRRHGLGHTLGFSAGRSIDRAYLGAVAVAHGVYALLCRGIAPSGLVATALLCAIFVRGGGLSLRGEHATWSSRLVIGFTCLAAVYRWTHPTFSPVLGGLFHIGCCCSE